MPIDLSKNMNAAEDFMLLILHAHVIAAARVIKDECPNILVGDLANSIVTKFVQVERVGDEECEDKVCLLI